MAAPRPFGGMDWQRVATASLWLIALGAIGVAVLPWGVGRPERHLAEAERLLEAGQPEAAAAWLDLPEARSRTADRARLLRARVALERGRPEAAVAPLEQIRADGNGPLAAEAAFWKGRVLLEVGNYPHALAWFGQALQQRSDDPDFLRWTAAAAYKLGDLDTVLRLLETLTRRRPDDAAAWRTLGLVYLEIPETGEAALDAASLAYQTSLRLDPNQPAVRLEWADVLVRQGAFEEAERQLEACQDRVPEGDWAHLRAQAAWGRGDRERVRAVLQDALAQNPDHPGLLAQKGLLAQAEGRFEDAVAWFDRAVAADPYDARAFYRRSQALRALGRSEAADQDAEQADALRRALQEMSALNAEAIDHPHDPDVRYRLGRLCQRLGKPALAASWYRAALACDPRHNEARAALAALRPR